MTDTKRGAMIVGFDGSIPARLALYWAAVEATSRRLPLRLVHVFRWPLPELANLGTELKSLDRDGLYEAARSALETAAERCADLAPDIDVSHDVLTGDPVAVLSAQAEGATMLVLGNSGQTGVDGILVGASAAELARRVTCPVVIVRPTLHDTRDDHRQRVVVGVDDSPAGMRALWFAFDFAARHRAELVAVHAWCDLPLEGLTSALDMDIDGALVHEEAGALLTAVLSGPAKQYPGVRVRPVVTIDRPARALLEETRGATLVVVGSHGRSQSPHVPLGSVSHALLHYASCSVAVVRTPG